MASRSHRRTRTSSTLTPLREAMPHQTNALEYAEPRRCLAAYMEMRLGKSLVATRWAKKKRPSTVLIIAPTSTIPDWLDELEREHVLVTYLQGSRKQRGDIAASKFGWFITNYESICIPKRTKHRYKRYTAPILELLWDVVILDESTRIKNPQAAITKMLLKYRKNFTYRAILSGYPAPESPLDYYCQMAFLYGTFLKQPNWWTFRQKLFRNPWGFEWIPQPGSLDRIKRAVHARAFVLRRKDVNIGSKKFYERRVVPMNPAQRRLIREIDDEFQYTVDNNPTVETKYVVATVAWLGRIAGGFAPDGTTCINKNKQKEILDLLKGELNNQSVVIWFKFNAEIKAMRSALDREGYASEAITGKVSIMDRAKIQQMFRQETLGVLLMQVKCGKMGIDLSAADTAIYYSNDYSGEARAQSEDRIIHPRKTRPLLYIDLITKGSIDEDIHECIRKKGFTARRFMAQLIERRYKWRMKR